MDLFYYLDLLAYKVNKVADKEVNKTTIENVL